MTHYSFIILLIYLKILTNRLLYFNFLIFSLFIICIRQVHHDLGLVIRTNLETLIGDLLY